MNKRYDGGCHCGAIGYSYATALLPAAWSVRACQCTFCLAHAALSTSDPAGRIEFETNNADLLQKYRFGLKTADFLLCRNCGVYIGASIATDRGPFGIINLRTLKLKPATVAAVTPITYDKEDTGDRVARRIDRWTPVAVMP
jgi:hypothetical protein